MKRIDYCLYIKARNGNGYEVTKYFRIGEFINLYREQFKRVCLSTVEIRKAFSRELFFLSNEDLHFDCFAFFPVSSLMTVEFFLDKELQQFIEILRKKYNAFVSWNEWDNIPKRALLIGDEVIPMPPIPDEYLEVYKSSIEKTCIKKSFEKTKRYCSNDSISIVLYAELTLNQRLVYSDYDETPYDYSRQDNIEYLWDLARNIETLARNDFENELNTSACQNSASVPIAGDSPAVPASAPVATIPPAAPASVPADNDSPADKTAKPERQKATEKDIQNAIAELQKYFRSNSTDYMQKTIIKHLEEKLGIVFDLSPRTRLGKFYAVLYYDKTGNAPRNWTISKVLDVKKILEKKVS